MQTRRAALAAFTLTPAAARAAQLTDQNAPVTRPEAGRAFAEAILPVPFGRATYRYDLGGGALMLLKQLLRFQNVSATVRMNVQRLRNGKLWVVAPVAPTGECLSLLKDIARSSTWYYRSRPWSTRPSSGRSSANFRPRVCGRHRGQYGPFGTLGFSPENVPDPTISKSTACCPAPQTISSPWSSEIETKTFYVDLPGNAGPVSEAAFFHKDSKTLFVTDAVSWIPR